MFFSKKENEDSVGGRLYKKLLTIPKNGLEALKMMEEGTSTAGYGSKDTLRSIVGVEYYLKARINFIFKSF